MGEAVERSRVLSYGCEENPQRTHQRCQCKVVFVEEEESGGGVGQRAGALKGLRAGRDDESEGPRRGRAKPWRVEQVRSDCL